MNTFDLLLTYTLKILPGFTLTTVLLLALPKRFTELRIAIYILLFILLRDAMTPVGLWRFGTDQFFWLRFIDNGAALAILALVTALLVAGMNHLDPDLKKLLLWKKSSHARIVIAGILGAAAIATPSLALSYGTPIDMRGGAVATTLLPFILLFSLIGNCYEEVLFRGYFQGYIEQFVSPKLAIILSGLMFSVGHIFLATTVTNAGIVILAFTMYEGLIAAYLRQRFGLWSAVIAHGGGIFLIGAGLI